MHQLKGTIALAGVLALAVGCGEGREARVRQEMQEVAAKAAAEKKEKEEKAKEEAMAREIKRKAEEAEAEKAYEAAKGALEPLAKLPKKRPKGFAAACSNMLEQYDAFMKKTLKGKELEKWSGDDNKRRIQILRRACHERPVEVAVCQTVVLEKAPVDADIDHIMRLCHEKFSG